MQTDEQFAVARVGTDAAVVAARGELGLASAAEFEAALETASDLGVGRVIADLAAVTILDSAGLGILLTSAQRLRMNGGELVVVTDDPRIIGLFERTRLDLVARLERSLLDAVSGLVPRPAAV